jgi:CSLREA domain-containing protein
MRSVFLRAWVTAAVILAAVSIAVPTLRGATFTVNSGKDEVDSNVGDKVCETVSGKCTLRAAVQEANARFGPDTIELGSRIHRLNIGGSGEDQAGAGDLDINDDLTIIGRGRSGTIIHSEVNDRVFHISDDAVVKFSGLKVQGGFEIGGGGIYNNGGLLTIVRCAVRNNAAVSVVSRGGSIYSDNNGTLKIVKSTVAGNLAKSTASYAHGGGIWFDTGTLKIIRSRITGNTVLASNLGALGGGVAVTQTVKAVIKQSSVSDNLAKGVSANGGGFYSTASTVTARKSKFLRNRAYATSQTANGGGVANYSTLTAVNCTFADNLLVGENIAYGGGIHNQEASGQASLFGCTFEGNTVLAFDGRGGGISNLSVTKVGSSVVRNNSAFGENEGFGGGIYSQGTLTVEDSSRIVGNTASADYGGVYGGGTFNLSNNSMVEKNVPNNTN